MKKTFKSLFAIAIAVTALVSCAKDIQAPVNADEELIEVTLIAGNPTANSADPASRTQMVDSTPKWCDGDKIGVSDGSTTNYSFSENSIADGETAAIATFKGIAVSGTLYAYSPYNGNGVAAKGAKVDIPANQNPTATSFDGAADIMVAKSFTVDPENTTVSGLQFARLGAIVKLVLTDSESTMVGTQHPTTVSMTAESDLVGRVYIDMVNQCINETDGIYSGGSHTVNANYSAETKYAINGTNATYLIVYPQTLAAGSTLTITASTEDYAIEKNITVPAGGIELLPGKVNTLNVSLLASHITLDSGATLPFNDNFSWQTGTGATEMTFATTPAIPSEKYSAYNKVFQGSATSVARLSTSSATGFLTTVELDLSSAFYVHINSKYWSDSDATRLYVSVDGGDPEEITLTSAYKDYYVNFAAATKKSKVKVTTTANKRAYIKSFDIVSGTYVFPPAINVTSDNPMAIDNTNDLHAITYTISHPTGASISASSNVAWIHDFDYTVDGEVAFEVDAQETDAEARTGVITLSYTGATNVLVTVNQAAGPASVPPLYLESFGDNGSNNTAVASANTYTATQSMFTDPSNSVVSHYSSVGKVGKNSVNPSSGYSGASGKSAVWYTAPTGTNTNNLFTVDKISISGATSISVSFGLFCSNAANTTVKAYYKIDSGSEQELSFTAPSSNSTWTLCSGSITGTGTSLKLRFEMTTTAGYTVRLDDIKVVDAN